MIIDGKNDSIWVRIPKTAGVSIKNELASKESIFTNDKKIVTHCSSENKIRVSQINGFHSSLAAYHKELIGKTNWNKLFRFTFVRNPFCRAVSSWKFGGWGKKWNCNFKEFAEHIKNQNLTNPNEWNQLGWHSCLQYPHIYTDSRECLVDFIGKFENLQEDFNIVCDKIGIPHRQLPHQNKTKHKHYTEYYDDETRQIVAEKYAKDIEYFNYKFGE